MPYFQSSTALALPVKIATWNLNSIRARLPRVLAALERHEPDLLCVQETKSMNDKFPYEELAEVGYVASAHGQKTYNGVALLLRSGEGQLENVRNGFEGNPIPEQARVISGVFNGIQIVNAYVVNGKEVGDSKFEMKLAWLDALDVWLKKEFDPTKPFLICGDFNITPDDRDVWDVEKWQGRIFCTDRERAFVQGLHDWGLQDLQRKFSDEAGLFTWWDYRGGSHPRNLGLRIDLMLASKTLASNCVAFEVDREERRKSTGEGAPSDHAPVIAHFS